MGNSLWEVTMQPVARGIVIYVTDGQIRSVVGRVSYDRWKSGNPWKTFKAQLLDVIERAEDEADRANLRRPSEPEPEPEEGMGTEPVWSP